VDTRSALECMKEMMTHTNIYVKDKQMSKQLADYMLIRNISAYLTDMLKVRESALCRIVYYNIWC